MELVNMLEALDRLTISKKPVWGKMKAQEMVEHLSDLLIISRGVKKFTVNENDETIARRQQFLYSDKEMARNIAVPFTKNIIELRHNELALSIDEFTIEWLILLNTTKKMLVSLKPIPIMESWILKNG